MFDVEDKNFMVLIAIFVKKSNIQMITRSQLESIALQYNITNAPQMKSKMKLANVLLQLWLDHFKAHPEFFSLYQSRWEIEISLEQIEEWLNSLEYK